MTKITDKPYIHYPNKCCQFYIKIIAIPDGEAPEYIRKIWVGRILPCIGVRKSYQVRGILTGQFKTKDDICLVPQVDALRILKLLNPTVAGWWYNQGFPHQHRNFCFKLSEVEIT